MSQRDLADPLVNGITKARLVRRRMRWAAALLGSAALLGVGSFLHGGYDLLGLAPLGFAIYALAILFAVLGLVSCVGALVVGFGSRAQRSALAIGIGMIAITVVAVSMVVFFPLLFFGLALIFVILVVDTNGGSGSAAAPPLPTWRRIVLALIFTMLTFAVVAAGVLHVTVWNPLAKVPGLSLDEIYAAMAAANESPLVVVIAGGAIFWGIGAVIFLILAGLPPLRAFFTARRIVVIGLLGVSATTGFVFFAGFGMGMSLADTFGVNGGDAAISGIVLAIVGQLAVVAALLIGLPPRRPHAELAYVDTGTGTVAGAVAAE